MSFSRCLFEFCTSTRHFCFASVAIVHQFNTYFVQPSHTPFHTKHDSFPHRIYNYITFNSCHLRTETQSSVLFYFPFVQWGIRFFSQIRYRFFDIVVVDVAVIVAASKWHVIKWTRLILFLFFPVIFYHIFVFSCIFFFDLFSPPSQNWYMCFVRVYCVHSLHNNSYLIESIRSSWAWGGTFN